MNSNKIACKGLLFDYGGTLDTRGDHWSEVIWDAYLHFGVDIDKAAFRDAYVHGERTLATHPIVTPQFHFRDVLREKLQLQLEALNGRLQLSPEALRGQAELMAQWLDEQTNRLLAENEYVLRRLKEAGYPMVLVSNFYGNISQVLRDARLDGYFDQIIESAVVGVRKPNPAIFALGVCALDLPASQVLVVGDTYTKDILPAHQLGCHTVWIKGRQWEEKEFDESVPDAVITLLDDLLPRLI